MKPKKLPPAASLLPRIFTVVAAILFVGAIAAATLAPTDMTLAEALKASWPRFPAQLETSTKAVFGGVLWKDLVNPLFERPFWLLPASIGLIFVGAAISSILSPPRQSRRKRS